MEQSTGPGLLKTLMTQGGKNRRGPTSRHCMVELTEPTGIDYLRGWQRRASRACDERALETHVADLSPASRALLLSQAGPRLFPHALCCCQYERGPSAATADVCAGRLGPPPEDDSGSAPCAGGKPRLDLLSRRSGVVALPHSPHPTATCKPRAWPCSKCLATSSPDVRAAGFSCRCCTRLWGASTRTPCKHGKPTAAATCRDRGTWLRAAFGRT